MKNTSYIIMWLTIFLVLILAMVLALVLLLLAELYCSPLIHRHRRRQLTPPTTTTTTGNHSLTHSPQHTHVSDPLHDTEKQQLHDQSLPETQQTVQKGCGLTDSVNGCSLIYISNPIYGGDGNGTPFETPDSSPSRLETEDSSSGNDEKEEVSSNVVGTMKKKKKVCVKDVGLLGISGSDTNGVSSSCSLTTPCTSPSL